MLDVAIWLAMAAAPNAAQVAGVYQIDHMEMGGNLELQPNGHFRYGFTYGAVDEEAEGDWSLSDGVVRLTSNPMPTEPTFDLVSDTPAPKCTLSLSVDWGKLGWTSAPDVLVTYEGAPRQLHLLQAEENGTVHLENCAVTTLLPIVPMVGVPGAPLTLSPATGHRLALRFRPNDLGHVAFRNQPLRIASGALVMERYDAEIRFLRDAP